MKRLFGPQTFRNGRVQLYGCSPRWILLSLILTVVLNLILRLVF